MFHERQIGTRCCIHSFNNAVGYHAIDTYDIESEINSVISRKAIKLEIENDSRNIKRSPEKIRRILDNMESQLHSENGDYSPGLLYEVANRFGYRMLDVQKTNDEGSFIILYDRPYGHAIAKRKGIMIDSEREVFDQNRWKNPISIYEIYKFK